MWYKIFMYSSLFFYIIVILLSCNIGDIIG